MYRNIDFDISDDGVGYLQSNSRFLPALVKKSLNITNLIILQHWWDLFYSNNGYHLS
jgi:hypothetical protein